MGEVPRSATLDEAMLAARARWFREWYDDPTKLQQPQSRNIIAEALGTLADLKEGAARAGVTDSKA